MQPLTFDFATVHVRAEPVGGRGDALPRSVVARALAIRPESVTVAHSCPRCGATDHGRLLVARPRARCFVNRSRTSGVEVAAVSTANWVGVDIESVDRIAGADMDAVLLHPAEADALSTLPFGDTDQRRALLWTAKEAVLKATGHGLNVDPQSLHLEVRGRRAELVGWPGELGLIAAPSIQTFAISDDIVGAVAVLA